MSKLEELETKELVIDPEFEKLISPLSEEEYRQLEENIEKNGCLHPITVWCDTIVDGHNRYQICRKLGVDFETKTLTFNDREEAKLWIIRHQLGRRNLQPFQRIELALKMKEAIAAQAKANQVAAGGAVPLKSAKAVDTRDVLSQLAGVSHDTISKAEKIANEASDEDKQKLRRGEVSINSVYQKLKKKDVAPCEQPSDEDKAHLATRKVCSSISDLQHISEIPKECLHSLTAAVQELNDLLSQHQS
jgi:ParB-like chromosome segregation protein Spo0J